MLLIVILKSPSTKGAVNVKYRYRALEVVDRAYRFILQDSKSLYIQAHQVSKSRDIGKQNKRVTKYKHVAKYA